MPETEWIPDSELDAVLLLLSTAVAGQPDADTGTPIECGVGSNAAAVFQNQTFAMRDFCWCEGGVHPEIVDWENDWRYSQMPPSGGTSSGCPVNFEHFASGIKGIWYKHLGRDNQYSRVSRPGEALAILTDCLTSIDYTAHSQGRIPWLAGSLSA